MSKKNYSDLPNNILDKVLKAVDKFKKPIDKNEYIQLDDTFKKMVDTALNSYDEKVLKGLVKFNYMPDKMDKIKNNSILFKKYPEDEKSDKIYKSKKELYDMLTDFNVTNLIKTPENKIYLVSSVNNTMNYLFDVYCKQNKINRDLIHFVYKGGNVLRLLIMESIKFFSLDAERIISDEYSEYFKGSDHDFEVKISSQNMDDTEFSKVYNELSFLVYLVLTNISEYFNETIDDVDNKYFDLFIHNDEYISHVANKQLNKMCDQIKSHKEEDYQLKHLVKCNGLQIRKNISSNEDTVYTGYSALDLNATAATVIIDNKNESENATSNIMMLEGTKQNDLDGNNFTGIHILPFSSFVSNYMKGTDFEKKSHSGYFYSQINNSISFDMPTGDLIKFNLMRVKYNTKFYFDWNNNGNIEKKYMNIPGEVIDISMSHKDSYVNLTSADLREYTLDAGELKYKFTSYTLNGLIKDLYFILYTNSDVPWKDVKYTKRVKRLFILYLFDILSSEKTDTTPAHKVRLINALIKTMKNNLNDDKTFEKNLENIENIHEYQIYNCFVALPQIIANGSDDEDNLNKYINVLNNELRIMKKIVYRIAASIERNNALNKKLLGTVSRTGLYGGNGR
jgi:hypothetical protein